MTNKPESHRTSPPDFLTVEEAAAVLRIGRTSAYRQARRYLATNGAEGLCADRFGKQIRIPRCYLEQRLGGPITWPIFVDGEMSTPLSLFPPAPSGRGAQASPARQSEKQNLSVSA
jgi:hypothetical protein